MFTFHKSMATLFFIKAAIKGKDKSLLPFVISDKVMNASLLQHFLNMPPEIIKGLFLLFYW